MKANYRLFPELVFIDCSIRQKNKAADQSESHYLTNFVFMPDYKGQEQEEYLHLIILSGLDSDSNNIVFGAAIVQ